MTFGIFVAGAACFVAAVIVWTISRPEWWVCLYCGRADCLHRRMR